LALLLSFIVAIVDSGSATEKKKPSERCHFGDLRGFQNADSTKSNLENFRSWEEFDNPKSLHILSLPTPKLPAFGRDRS